jgi:hypothetical protein
LPASDGPTVSTGGSGWNWIGSAPNFRLVARLCAWASSKSPVICASPLWIRASIVGAEITTPSSTMANCRSVPNSASEIRPNSSEPGPLNRRVTP